MTEIDTANPQASSAGGSWLTNNRFRLLVVGLVLALSLGYLLYTAFPGNLQFYVTVSEFLADESNLAGSSGQVAGKLDPESYSRAEGTLDHSFTLVEGGQRLDAEYSGILSDLFHNKDTTIVLEGTYQGGTFYAESMNLKCPSKYEAAYEERTTQ